MKKILYLFCFLSFASIFGQRQMNASEIKLALEKLNTLGSVLYLAAHPDDENTRLIAYMANEKMARTGYLALTRGDGGQNLIGTEKGALLGVLRTHELLAARRVDGGEQFFTRAVDFGFSKTPEETFTKWDRNKVLADVVWTIRKFRPEVIITRFPPNSSAGHGHHTASAILAAEAFDLAADPKAYSEQLQYVSVWQPKRLFLNVSTWWDDILPEKAKNNPTQYITIDIGTYNTLLGQSYTEMAAESRTMHKSQGFGTRKRRGSQMEYLKLVKGEPFKTDIFDGINTNWNSVKGGDKIKKLVTDINTHFEVSNPSKSVPKLIEVMKLIQKIPDNYWSEVKLKEIKKIIASSLGLFSEVTANDYSTAVNSTIQLTTNIVNRSNVKVVLTDIKYGIKDTLINLSTDNNKAISFTSNYLCANLKNTNPYWLNDAYLNMYSVNNQTQIGLPKNNPTISVVFNFKINDVPFSVHSAVTYKSTDRVKGEIYRPFVVLPSVTANITENIYIFSTAQPKTIKVNLKAHQPNVKGTIALDIPKGWSVTPASISYELAHKNDEKIFTFSVIPVGKESTGEVKIRLNNNNQSAKSLVSIDYDHVPTQTLLPEAKAKLVRLNVQTKGKNIGYIKGAGDEIPIALEQLGYQVTILNETSIKNNDLSVYDAIICGIRGYNTNKYMPNIYNKLMTYIKNGGNYIVQYNTNRGLENKKIGPYPFQLSRNRTTVEDAKTTLLSPKHPILNTPNKIELKDFDNWIQERGLYYPSQWDQKYTPILGWADPNENMTKGALLVTNNYGKGSFIYTGISFFRELPAGIPGAFKLFANIVSYGK